MGRSCCLIKNNQVEQSSWIVCGKFFQLASSERPTPGLALHAKTSTWQKFGKMAVKVYCYVLAPMELVLPSFLTLRPRCHVKHFANERLKVCLVAERLGK